MMKDIIAQDNFMLWRIEDFKLLFKDVFWHGFPNFWNEQGLYLSEEEYHIKLSARRNDTSHAGKIMTNVKGKDIFDVLDKYLYLLHETRKIIFVLPPVTYKFHSKFDAINREMLAVAFP